MKPALCMTWLMEILEIYLEGQFLIKYYVIKHLILLKAQDMIDMNVNLLQWFIIFHAMSSDGAVTRANKSAIKSKTMKSKQLIKELYKPIIKKMENEKCTNLLNIIFGVLI